VTIRRTCTAAVATLALLGLAACGSDDEPQAESSSSASASSSPSAEATEESTSTEGAPAWAKPVTTPGTKIGTVKAGDVTVDVYQVGTTKATKTGNFVDPKDNKPIIAVGDEIVFVNYVVTNTGDPVDLGSSLVDVSARYVDWPYLQGMDGITDNDLYEAQDVQTSGVAPGAFVEPSVYTLGKGETFSYGENFRYEKGTKLEVKVTYTPVDAEGELLHDDRVEGEGSATIS